MSSGTSAGQLGEIRKEKEANAMTEHKVGRRRRGWMTTEAPG
jgi:hypothetical protein